MTNTRDDFRQRACIAAPCPGVGEDHAEGRPVSICSRCGLFVYDLTGLDGQQASNLTLTTEALPGPRFFRRQDGKFLTRNCPVGLQDLRARLRRSAG
ncbi:MAG: hypothetical protein R3F56_03710 [Planctomycetota bacterium]